jgi:hypothetical protein
MGTSQDALGELVHPWIVPEKHHMLPTFIEIPDNFQNLPGLREIETGIQD